MSLMGLDLSRDRTGGDPNYRLDVGSVLARTLNIWGGNIVSFCLVGVVVHLPVLIGFGIISATGENMPLAARLLKLLSNILNLILTGAVTYGVFQHVQGEKAGVGDVLRKGFSRLGQVWGVGIMTGIATILGFCLLVVPGLILLTRYWIAVPVAVIEAPGVFASMQRSVDLTEGNRWRVFALAILTLVAVLAASLFLVAMVGLLTQSEGVRGRVGLSAGVQALLELLVIPLQVLAAVAPALAYHDLRVGKEGADVEELLSAFD